MILPVAASVAFGALAFLLALGNSAQAYDFNSIIKDAGDAVNAVQQSVTGLVEGDGTVQDSPQGAEPLPSYVMRQVNAANIELDKAEEDIGAGRLEFAPAKLKNAQKEYALIASRYQGKYDPAHPEMVQLKQRLERVSSRLSSADTQDQAVAQQSGDTSSDPGSESLSSNIKRQIMLAGIKLDSVEKGATLGRRNLGELESAKARYDEIFVSYQGFNPNHPNLVALKLRIAKAEALMATVLAEQNASTPLEQGSEAVDDLPDAMAKQLVSVASALRSLEERLKTANSSGFPGSYVAGVKQDYQIASEKMSVFMNRYGKQIKIDHIAYVQVKNRLAKGKAGIDELESRVAAKNSAKQAEASHAENSMAKKIMSRYPNQQPTSNLHRDNVGRIVWSKKSIAMNMQDRVKVATEFSLTDPIYGRLYTERSIANTPVYSRVSSSPQENSRYGYEFRLFIDGKERVDRFGVFVEGTMDGESGEQWTTWRFTPHAIPADPTFGAEADAWRRTTKDLALGSHTVTFELWGVQGQLKTRNPMAVGEFSLLVNKGDKVGAASQFPGDSYTGGDLETIRGDMLKALRADRENVLKISVTSDWKHGIFSDTKRRYRSIMGTILWRDTDNDSVCRYTSMSFIASSIGGDKWAPLKFKGYSVGRLEGDASCP